MTPGNALVLYCELDPARISERMLAQWLAGFPGEKRRQITKRHPHPARVQSAAGWLLVEQGMRKLGFSQFSLAEIDFSRRGKAVANYPADFNISHSGDLVCAAFIRDGRIGIDVERQRPLKQDVIHKYLSPELARQCEAEPLRFFDYWTALEAVLKAYGHEGLVRVREIELQQQQARFADQTWHLTPLNLIQGYAGCIATDVSVTGLQLEKVLPG